MQEKYDVIVIGAGIGGLTAAAILAKNGKKVLVLEKNPVPGGYAVNFRRGDFVFDASLHMIDGCSEGSPPYNILKKCNVLNKICFVKPEHIYRTIFPDFDFRVPQMNIDKYANILTKYFPNERKGIERFFREIYKIFIDGKRFLYTKTPFMLEIFYFPFKYPSLFKYSYLTLQSMLDKFLKDKKLKSILSQLWLYYGLSPFKLSAFYYSYPTFDYLNNGATYIKGGSQSLSNAFLDTIIKNNGTVLFNSEVQKIIVEDNNIKGVITQRKDTFSSGIIISSMDALKTFFHLIGRSKLSKYFIKKLENSKPSLSIFVIYLGLNLDFKKIGINDYEIFYNPNYDLDKQFEACVNNNMEEVPLVLAIYSNVDEEAAPKGKGLMSIATLSGYDFWSNLNKDDYRKKKNDLANILIKRAERIIPNLSSCIEVLEIATPLTMERYTGNYKGSIYGWDQLLNQSGIRRLSQKTPIKNLYLASAWTRPGGGMTGVMYSGEHIAEEILKVLE